MAKSFIGMNGFNPNEYAKFENGINTYTCVTSSKNHALTGSGNNIKFVADAAFNSGDTITVNGEAVTAQTQDGIALQGGAWAAGATVVCYLNNNVLNFKGGGGKVTVTGLSANVVLSGNTITVKQGTNTIQQVTGAAKVLYAGGCLTGTYAGGIRWNGTTYVYEGHSYFYLVGQPKMLYVQYETTPYVKVDGKTYGPGQHDISQAKANCYVEYGDSGSRTGMCIMGV